MAGTTAADAEQDVPATATFVPTESFYGYPEGEEVFFEAGKESIPVSPEYAALIRAKNLAPDK
jgi:hypothetical protein